MLYPPAPARAEPQRFRCLDRWLLSSLAFVTLLLAEPAWGMDDCHSQAAPESSEHRYRARIGFAGARYKNDRYEGDYQGALLGFDIVWPRASWGVSVPVYRLVRNGRENQGLGDIWSTASVSMFESAERTWAMGGTASVSLPTGNASTELGMGHVMVMPSFWLTASFGRVSTRLHLGYGLALEAAAGEHDHNAMHPIVQPMNKSELDLGAHAQLRIVRGFEVTMGALFATPVATSGGSRRGSAYLGLILRVHPRFDLGIEGHLPWIGDAFLEKVRVNLQYRF